MRLLDAGGAATWLALATLLLGAGRRRFRLGVLEDVGPQVLARSSSSNLCHREMDLGHHLCVVVPSHASGADQVLWQFNTGGQINAAQPMPNGHVLISDKDGGRVIEVNRSLQVLRSIAVDSPDQALVLDGGQLLIVQTGEQTVIEGNLDDGSRALVYGVAFDAGWWTHCSRSQAMPFACRTATR